MTAKAEVEYRPRPAAKPARKGERMTTTKTITIGRITITIKQKQEHKSRRQAAPEIVRVPARLR